MARFQDVIEYVCSTYRSDYQLTEDRLALLLYLVDWRSAIQRNTPVTDIEWVIQDFGPRPNPVSGFALAAVTRSPLDFSSIHRTPEEIAANTTLDSAEREVVDFVIRIVAAQSDTELQRLVFSTFPVLAQPKRAPLNLVALAAKYNREYRHAVGSE